MKKMNKKGFTLAELLIVIAIIAILIAIAIPAFSGALDNARLQTDHANMRSAYSMVQAANLLGQLDNGSTTIDVSKNVNDGKYVFKKDGTLGAKGSADDAYLTQAKHNGSSIDSCKASIVCQKLPAGDLATGNMIIITVDSSQPANSRVSISLGTSLT